MPDIEIKRGYEVLPDNNIRFGIRVINNSEFLIVDVEVILDYSDSLFKLEGNLVHSLGIINPTAPRTAEFILKPLACIHKEEISATVRYKDHTGKRYTVDMHPKEVHCVCPFLKEKAMTRTEFLDLSKSGYSAEAGLNFHGVNVRQLFDFLVKNCKNRHYKVDEFSVDGGKMLYLASESIGEKATYLITAFIRGTDGLAQVMLKATSDKPYGLNGFLNEMVETLRHIVSTVKSAKEIGVIKKEQVINIIDSVVQRTSFGGGEGASSINIKDSVVQRTEIKVEDEKQMWAQQKIASKIKEKRWKFIEEALNTLQKNRKYSFVIFSHTLSDFFIQFRKDDNNLILDFPYGSNDIFDDEVLKKFKNLINADGIKYYDSGDYIEIDFRNDIEKTTDITGRIFRDVYNLNYEFELKVKFGVW